ncbi:MAG: HPP family protein [Pseudorhizobium sp.]
MPLRNNSPAGAKAEPSFRLFHPILAGATLKDRLLGCLGALLGITLTGLICSLVTRDSSQLPLIVAPIGASAVLLFAVPASPLAQPWPVVGGNVISAAVGMSVAWMVDIPALAVGLSVAAAIGIMSVTRSLHPPGGAVALTAALGGTAASDWGALFPLVPVGLNSCLLVVLAIAFHRLGGRSYPHKPVHPPVNLHQTDDLPSSIRVGFNQADVDAALDVSNETFDIDPGDLTRLLQRVELQALLRSHGDLCCADIMSRDVIFATVDTAIAEAERLLLGHNIRTLPIVEDGRLIGTVGLRELSADGSLRDRLTRPATAAPEDPVVALLPALTDGVSHAVIVIDAHHKIRGIISQTDMLAAMSKMLLAPA